MYNSFAPCFTSSLTPRESSHVARCNNFSATQQESFSHVFSYSFGRIVSHPHHRPLPFVRAEDPPRTWVDKDTGHRIWRLSDEPNSGGFYFNVNAYTPDHKQMIYTAPDGIHVLDMATRTTRLVQTLQRDPSAARAAGASRNPHALVAGSKTNSVFFTQLDPVSNAVAVYKADTTTGAIRKLTDLPPKISIVSVNADETLAAGAYN
jgi:oligogalacturonide lyase